MYVYYENYEFNSQSSTKIQRSFYTHKITVYENCNKRDLQLLQAKTSRKLRLTCDNRIYFRETARRCKVSYKRNKLGGIELDFATSENYALSLEVRKDAET